MVLFFFNSIIKNQFKKLSNESVKSIGFDKYRQKKLNLIIKIFPKYFENINEKFIEKILSDSNNHIVFANIDNIFSIENITSILIYHKTNNKTDIKYYMLLFGTHCDFRNLGYGKSHLDEFINWIKINNLSNKKIKIILKAVESSLGFFQSYGFFYIGLESYKLLFKYEPIDELKSNQEKILVYLI